VPEQWIGLALDDARGVVGIGAAAEGPDGRWWCVVGRARPEANSFALMRGAREILETARAAGVPLHAFADPDIPGSDRFLMRIGFAETSEMVEQHRVWTWIP